MTHVAERWLAEMTDVARRLPAPLPDLIEAMTALVGRDPDRARTAFDAARESGASEQQIDDLVECVVLAFGMSEWTSMAWRTLEPPPEPPADSPRAEIAAHFASTGDLTPMPVELLVDRIPDLARLYLDTRASLFADEEVDPAVRELLLALVSARAGYVEGGRRHLARARQLGLSRETLRMALSCVVLIEGGAPWRSYCESLWKAFDA
jgi:alkylhydroperoxidase/carboxymuconolactone decarboxylase family protein YurZ